MRTAALCGMSALGLTLGFLAGQPAARLPQSLSGGDFLSVLLGDAKVEISDAFVHEADSYFHGGVDMDCHELGGGGTVAHHHHDAACGCGHHAVAHGDHGTFDPWRWINSHVRAPEIERHLEGEKAVEMMPWFWAAVRSDPHNVEAWSTAWYVASHMMKDDRLALRIAEEGWRLNIASMEMACVVGRACRAKGTLDARRSEEMFMTAFEMGLRKEEMAEKERFAFFEAIAYLTDYAKRRKDKKALIGLKKKIGLRWPDQPVVGSLVEAIKSL